MNIGRLYFLIPLLLICSPAFSGATRPAYGKPCLPTEDAYYKEDGVTAEFCESARGPAYVFKVFVGGKPLWEGRLAPDAAEASFSLSPAGQAGAHLVLRRSNPAGDTLFFGETRPQSFRPVVSGGSTISLPEATEVGLNIRADRLRDGTTVDVGTLPGSASGGNSYMLEIRHE